MQHIYNSQSQTKEQFQSIEPNVIRMYVCGPTVYGLLHVGNFRGPVFFNLVRNWFEKNKYKVNFIYNYTDVDDKIIKKALDEKSSAQEVSEKYIAEFETDFASLKLKSHTGNPRVTEYISVIIDFIEKLIQKNKAYLTSPNELGAKDVVFSIASFAGYGKLSGRDPEDLLAGARVEKNESKQNPLDFVLWKGAKPGEPSWESPWGPGRPGWHIECSAMIRALLGEQIDIHGGGSDLIFPHHENELAQTEALTDKPFVRYWMHNNMLTFGAQKMSKSTGNIRSLREFINTYNAEVYKYVILSVHYRSLLEFTDESVLRSLHGLGRIYSSLAFCERLAGPSAEIVDVDAKFADAFAAADRGIRDALDDDFNTPEMMARIFELVRQVNSQLRIPGPITPARKATARRFVEWVRSWGQLLSLFQEPPVEFLRQIDDRLLAQKGIARAEIQTLVDNRSAARKSRDFKKADQLREELVGRGVLLFDSLDGTVWEMQK